MIVTDYVKQLQGKNRYELMNVNGVFLPDGRALVADVYDDYVIFNLLEDNNDRATALLMLSIDALNNRDADSIAQRIDDELAKH